MVGTRTEGGVLRHEADVIVIGSGLSGLVAACEAAEQGRSVLVVDGEGPQSLGGQAFWSFGGLLLVDSPEQRRLGIRDSPELAHADWLGAAQFEDGPNDAQARQWARAYLEFASGELREWLRRLAVGLFPVVGWAERGGQPAGGHGNSVPRFHIVWGTGPALLHPFVARALASPLITFAHRHLVRDLSVTGEITVSGDLLAPDDAERGRPTNRDVVGSFTARGESVIIASGGIGGNLDLVREFWPGRAPEKLIKGVPDYVDGSMLPIAEAAGGALVNRNRMWHYPEGVINHSPLWTDHGIRILPGPSSLWLDANGVRLPPPNFPGFDALGALRAITEQGHDHSWFVTDAATVAKEFALSGSEQNSDLTGKDLRMFGRRTGGRPTAEVRRFVREGVDFLTAGTVGDLAAQMNALEPDHTVDGDALLELIRERDLQIRAGLGKDPQVVALRAARNYLGDRLMRIASPHPMLAGNGPRRGAGGPLVAVRLHPLTRKTLGGLQTDLEGRVLAPDGTPLPGVFAAGEAAGFGGGGVHGHRALEGTFLGGCLLSGRIAGRSAAALG